MGDFDDSLSLSTAAVAGGSLLVSLWQSSSRIKIGSPVECTVTRADWVLWKEDDCNAQNLSGLSEHARIVERTRSGAHAKPWANS